MKALFSQTGMILVLCLTLGLAPFIPEPHLVGKIRWIAGGAVGMKTIDWFDALFHGFPWLLLIASVAYRIKSRKERVG